MDARLVYLRALEREYAVAWEELEETEPTREDAVVTLQRVWL